VITTRGVSLAINSSLLAVAGSDDMYPLKRRVTSSSSRCGNIFDDQQGSWAGRSCSKFCLKPRWDARQELKG